MFSYWAKPEHTLDLCRLLNDHIAGVVAAHPKRFVGLGSVPLQDPELAIEEMERCMRELRLAGIEIGSHVNSRNLDDQGKLVLFKFLFEYYMLQRYLEFAAHGHYRESGKIEKP